MNDAKISFAHRAEAALVGALIGLLKTLSPLNAARLGKAVAGKAGPLIATSRTADKNLQFAMPELNAAQRKRIIREIWENLGQTVAELARLRDIPLVPDGAPGPGYSIVGWDEHVAPLLQPGQPAMFFTGHIGNWELLVASDYPEGIDFGFMYRAASNPLVNDMILRLREANARRKVSMFPKGASGGRAAFAHLRQGGFLGLLVDQKLDTGLSVPFFGKPAMTMDALANFALRFRCPVFPVHVERLGPARLRVVYEPALSLPESGDKQAGMLALTTEMNRTLERWVRANPGSWLWLHRRWPKGTA